MYFVFVFQDYISGCEYLKVLCVYIECVWMGEKVLFFEYLVNECDFWMEICNFCYVLVVFWKMKVVVYVLYVYMYWVSFSIVCDFFRKCVFDIVVMDYVQFCYVVFIQLIEDSLSFQNIVYGGICK